MTIYIEAMKQYFDFKGRATRKQFWLFSLYFFILAVVAMTIDMSMGNEEVMIISAIVVIPHYIPLLAIGARRLHDIGRSGWWQLIWVVPVVQFLLLIFWCKKSAQGENRFGLNPHGDIGDQTDTSISNTQQATGDVVGRIEKLTILRNSGAIDENEFQRLKAEAIGSAG